MIISRIAMVLVLLSSATPALAQSVTAFDGTYIGISMINSNSARYCTPPSRPAPGTLTIVNGAARLPWGPGGTAPLEGTVRPDGTLVMRQATSTTRFDGRVAGGGAVSGGITWGGAAVTSGPCVWTLTWQKKG